MQSKVNYTAVGIFVVTLSFCLVIMIIWLSTIAHGKKYHNYMVHMTEDVSGLAVESPVRFNGVKVGYVKSVHLDPSRPKLVKIILAIEEGTPISTSTYAVLNMQGVTGVVYVNLKAGTEDAPPLLALPGQPLPIIPSKPSFLTQLSESLPEVAEQIKRLSVSIGKVLDEQNQKSIKASLKNISAVTQALSNNSENFSQALHSMSSTLYSVNQFTTELQKNPSMLVRGKQPARKGPGE